MRQIAQWLTDYAEVEVKGGILSEAEFGKRREAMREMAFLNPLYAGHKERFAEAMTTAHFATYFGDALDRMFYDAYEWKQGSWKQYTYADTVPDFRDVDRGRMSQPETLSRRREKAEMKATYVEADWIHYGVEEYAKQFDVPWQTLLNDDLGEIQRTPARMLDAAVRFEDAFVSALYDNATTQATAIAAGVVYGGTGRLTAANLAIGINAMYQRVDAAGNPIQIRRIHLVIPPVLQIQMADILGDLLSYGGPGGNVLMNFINKNDVHVDPYITCGIGGALNIPWYLFADPSEIPVVTVARLRGVPGPATFGKLSDIRMMSGSMPAQFLLGSFATGDIEYGVESIIGGWDDAAWVGVTDFRGLYYSNGTTP